MYEGAKLGLGSETLITEVQDLLGGRLVIPSIQRGYVWKAAQVPYLLDSLYRGYPIGSLLIWKTTLDIPLKQAAVLQTSQNQLHPSVLLDGQQRLTSLAKVIAPDKVVGKSIDVRFHVDDEYFTMPSTAQRNNPRLIKVSQLLADVPQFGPILAAAGIDQNSSSWDEMYRRLHRVHSIRNQPVPVTTVESDDYEVVAEIFARVNQGGRRLSKGDLVYSAIAARWPDGLKVIEEFDRKLDKRNFALDREAVLRLTGTLAGTGAHVIRLIDKSVSGIDLKDHWSKTEVALGYAVDFLTGICHIPRSAVLSSPNLVIIPAYFLYLRKNKINDSDADDLRRWVYTAMAFSYYSNQVEGKIDADAKLVREKQGFELFDSLVRRASGARPVGTPIEESELADKKSSSSWFNLLYISTLRAASRDWIGGTALLAMPMESTSKIEYHHIFPRAKVAKRYGLTLTNSIANLAFISAAANKAISAKDPASYLPTIPADRLTEQAVPTNPTLWELDTFPEFLEQRRIRLAARLNTLLGLSGTPMPHSTLEEQVDDDEEAFAPQLTEANVSAEPELPANSRRGKISGTSSKRPAGSVASHVLEVLRRHPKGTRLTVSELGSAESELYQPHEVSLGAINQALRGPGIPGVVIVEDSRPLTVFLA